MTRHDLVIWGGSAAVLLTAITGLAPGLSWLDAGDFVAATATLGVPHPTGFAPTTLGGHLLTWLPVGSIPTRVAFLSALSMAGATGLLLATLKHLGIRPIPIAATALLLYVGMLTMPTLHIHARVPEIYATNLLLCSAGLYLVARYRNGRDARFLALLAFVIGLGLTHHALFRLWGPTLLLGALACTRETWPTVRRHLPAAAGFGALGLVPFAYLPAASRGEPAHNWGQPDTFARFWDHIHASTVREAFGDAMLPSVHQLGFNALEVFSQLIAGVGPFLFIAPPAALTAAALAWSHRHAPADDARRRWEIGTLAGALIVLDVGYAIAINPMGNRDLQNLQITGTLLLIVGATGLMRVTAALQRRALAASEEAREIEQRRQDDSGPWHRDDEDTPEVPVAEIPREIEPSSLPGAITVITLSLVLLTVLPHGQEGIGRDHSLEELTLAHLADAEPGSLTTTFSDSLTASFLYATVVLGQRPDAAFIGRHELTLPEALAWTQRRLPFPLVPDATLQAWLAEGRGHFNARNTLLLQTHLPQRPVYWEASLASMDLPPELLALPAWPLARVAPLAALDLSQPDTLFCMAPPARSYCDGRHTPLWGRSARHGAGHDFVEYRRFMADQLNVVGGLWLQARDTARAEAAFRAAIGQHPEGPSARSNLAVALATRGELQRALQEIDAALRHQPTHRTALRNGLRYAEALGDDARAEKYRRRMERLGL